MTAPAVTALVAEPLAQAVRRMHEHRVGSVVVVKERVPVGIVTERDVLRLADAFPDLGGILVADARTSPVDTVDTALDPAGALTTMR